jgi:hypothetical protein
LQDGQYNQHDGEDGNCGPGKQALFQMRLHVRFN